MQFYDLSCLSKSPVALWDDKVTKYESIKCPIEEGHKRGARVGDLTIHLSSDRVLDIMRTWNGDCLITDKVARLFAHEGFTGYHLRPVTVSRITRGNKDVSILPKLWELRVFGWGGMAPPESGIKLRKSCPACGYYNYTGLSDPSRLIVASQWDGSDFFIVWPLPRFTMITERVRKLIIDQKIKGCKIIPVEEMNTSDGYTPGRLGHWMPEERARKLGEPLGIY
jgi:hypothetical protein